MECLGEVFCTSIIDLSQLTSMCLFPVERGGIKKEKKRGFVGGHSVNPLCFCGLLLLLEKVPMQESCLKILVSQMQDLAVLCWLEVCLQALPRSYLQDSTSTSQRQPNPQQRAPDKMNILDRFEPHFQL